MITKRHETISLIIMGIYSVLLVLVGLFYAFIGALGGQPMMGILVATVSIFYSIAQYILYQVIKAKDSLTLLRLLWVGPFILYGVTALMTLWDDIPLLQLFLP